jgi:phosphate transport system permease protein
VNSTIDPKPRSAAETQERVRAGLARRYRAEKRFRAYGMAAIAVGVAFVIFLFGTVFAQGLSVLRQAYVQVEVFYDPEVIDPAGNRDPDDLVVADYQALVRESLRVRFPAVEGRPALRELYGIVSSAAAVELQQRVTADPGLIGQRERLWVLADDTVDMYLKGRGGPQTAAQRVVLQQR